MLNLKSKDEVQQAILSNQDRFAQMKERLINRALRRDKAILIESIIPEFKRQLALSNYFKIEWFTFTLPLMSFEGFEVPEEEVQRILKHYYLREGVLWLSDGRGEVSTASTIGQVFDEELSLKTDVVFKECTINRESGLVSFKLHITESLKKAKVTEELKELNATIDEMTKQFFDFESVASAINLYYQQIRDNKMVVLYEGDLQQLPILTINMDLVAAHGHFLTAVGMTDEEKPDFRHYLKGSKLVAQIQRKLKKFGYSLEFQDDRNDDDWFRVSGFKVLLNVLSESSPSLKDKDKILLVPSEVLIEEFNEKKAAYDSILIERGQEENDRLIQAVESGQFDELVASKLMAATLMYRYDIIRGYNTGRYFGDKLNVSFTLPFNREFDGLIDLGRRFHIYDGVGTRYLQMENNILQAMYNRYPFFKEAGVTGDDFYDYRYREGAYDTREFHVEENTLSFGFYFEEYGLGTVIEEVFDFLKGYYGTLDIASFMEHAQLEDEAISNRIQEYVAEQSKGIDVVQSKFEIVLGEMLSDDIMNLYLNSSIYPQTKEMFENKHTNEPFYSDRNPEYVAARLKDIQSVKVSNLLAYSIYTQESFKRMKKELAAFNYQLKVKIESVEKVNLFSGEYSLPGNKIFREVTTQYKVQLVIQ